MSVMSSNGTRMIQFGLRSRFAGGRTAAQRSRVKLQEQPLQILTCSGTARRGGIGASCGPACGPPTLLSISITASTPPSAGFGTPWGDSAENPRFVETVARRGLLSGAGQRDAAAVELTSSSSAPARPNLVNRLGGGGPACGRIGCGVVSGSARIADFARISSHRRAPPDRQSQRVLHQQRRPFIRWQVPGIFRRHRILPAPGRYR